MTTQIHLIDGNVREYKQARILDNGWVKGLTQSGGEDYYPEHRIKHVTGNVYVGDGNAV